MNEFSSVIKNENMHMGGGLQRRRGLYPRVLEVLPPFMHCRILAGIFARRLLEVSIFSSLWLKNIYALGSRGQILGISFSQSSAILDYRLILFLA